MVFFVKMSLTARMLSSHLISACRFVPAEAFRMHPYI